MSKKKDAVIKISMFCAVCKSRNYMTKRNKINTLEKLVMKKYCKKCKKHTEHKESGKLD